MVIDVLYFLLSLPTCILLKASWLLVNWFLKLFFCFYSNSSLRFFSRDSILWGKSFTFINIKRFISICIPKKSLGSNCNWWGVGNLFWKRQSWRGEDYTHIKWACKISYIFISGKFLNEKLSIQLRKRLWKLITYLIMPFYTSKCSAKFLIENVPHPYSLTTCMETTTFF